MVIEFNISPGGSEPIYKQIMNQVRRGISSGKLRPGDMLPSIRGLAESLVVNPNTIAKAYREMVQEGIIESRQGIGYLIAKHRKVLSDDERFRRLDQSLELFINDVVMLDMNPKEILKALEKKLQEINKRK